MPPTGAAVVLGTLLLSGGTARTGDETLADDLRRLLQAPGASGYEGPVRAAIRARLPSWADPVEDNLGNLTVTIGSGRPHRLLVAHMDEAGYVVSHIREDGYLRVQRLARVPLPPLFDQYHVGQPLVVGTRGGELAAVAAVLSTHLWRGRDAPLGRMTRDEELLVDIGARSAQEVAGAGVSLLDPIVIRKRVVDLAGGWMAGPAFDNRAGCATLLDLLSRLEPVKVPGTLTADGGAVLASPRPESRSRSPRDGPARRSRSPASRAR